MFVFSRRSDRQNVLIICRRDLLLEHIWTDVIKYNIIYKGRDVIWNCGLYYNDRPKKRHYTRYLITRVAGNDKKKKIINGNEKNSARHLIFDDNNILYNGVIVVAVVGTYMRTRNNV